ncbi:uncharacterized protein LOC122671818 [Telopea speciosissima]|uniref:uncharacterized protein LOC122671818 n=1 Tax=Telopea speciosissima TaxID=54955 RepID=UPI001CC49191|nr:uncharacterized protein LOC122671818 [Telopea speciosissima]
MHSNNTELPQKSLQIKEDNKFFSRLLTKEKSMANSSFRVYYGGSAGSVPFMWESQPGTPKHAFSDTSLPPLTPPPSFHSHLKQKSVKKPSKTNLLHTILPKLSLKKSQIPPLPPSPTSSLSWSSSLSSSSSSSSTTPTTPSNFHRNHRRISSSRLSFDSKGEDEYQGFGYPTSTMCFGVGRESSSSNLSGCNSIMVMKNAFLSIVGHRSDRGTTV